MRRVLAEDEDDKSSATDDGEGTGEGDDSKDEDEETEEEEDKSGIDKKLVLADPKHKANFVICAEKIE